MRLAENHANGRDMALNKVLPSGVEPAEAFKQGIPIVLISDKVTAAIVDITEQSS